MAILTILISFISIIAYSEEIEIPRLEIVSQNISEEESNVDIYTEPEIEFNLRLSPIGIEAYLNGSSKNIKEITLEEGKKLRVKFKEPLKYGEKYVLRILGVKEIYSGKPMANVEINFTTEYKISIFEEIADNAQKSYSVRLKNFSAGGMDIKQVIVAKNSEGNKILDVFVQSLYIEGGEEKSISHTFGTLSEEIKISGYIFSDINSLQHAED